MRKLAAWNFYKIAQSGHTVQPTESLATQIVNILCFIKRQQFHE